MTPIHQLLARIRWDPQFARSRFEIAYVDHREARLVRVPFERISLAPSNRFGFDAAAEDATVRFVPYHRVRQVWRDGTLIWSRER